MIKFWNIFTGLIFRCGIWKTEALLYVGSKWFCSSNAEEALEEFTTLIHVRIDKDIDVSDEVIIDAQVLEETSTPIQVVRIDEDIDIPKKRFGNVPVMLRMYL